MHRIFAIYVGKLIITSELNFVKLFRLSCFNIQLRQKYLE
jgi:hypothetical protein